MGLFFAKQYIYYETIVGSKPTKLASSVSKLEELNAIQIISDLEGGFTALPGSNDVDAKADDVKQK
jgi:hypothetical protein